MRRSILGHATRLVSRLLACVVVLSISVLSLQVASTGAVAASSLTGPALQQPSQEQVIQVLQGWRDKIKPLVPDEVRSKVEEITGKYPLEAPQGASPISFTVQDGERLELSASIQRRDWAYAFLGTGYTLAGAVGQDQKPLLDAGFWCFLEAALLKPDETDHLSNVGFHLNQRAEYDDALLVLRYAGQLAAGHSGVRTNLAHAFAGKGDFPSALEESRLAALLEPGDLVYQERYAQYLGAAGFPERAKPILDMVEAMRGLPVGAAGSVSLVDTPELSEEGKRVLDQIDALSDELGQAIETVREGIRPEWEGKALQGAAEIDATLNDVNECLRRVADANKGVGGTELSYFWCVQCWSPGAQRAMDTVNKIYSDLKTVAARFEGESIGRIQEYAARVPDLLSNPNLSSEESFYLLIQAKERIGDRYLESIRGPRSRIDEIMNSIMMDYQQAMEAGCGDAPVSPLVYNPRWTPMDPLFDSYVDLIVMSVETTKQGDIKLSLGQGVMLKLQYNLETHEFGIGGGLGVSFGNVIGVGAGPLMKAELSAVYRYRPGPEQPDQPKENIDYTAQLKFKLPAEVPWAVPGGGPKVTTKMLSLEN